MFVCSAASFQEFLASVGGAGAFEKKGRIFYNIFDFSRIPALKSIPKETLDLGLLRKVNGQIVIFKVSSNGRGTAPLYQFEAVMQKLFDRSHGFAALDDVFGITISKMSCMQVKVTFWITSELVQKSFFDAIKAIAGENCGFAKRLKSIDEHCSRIARSESYRRTVALMKQSSAKSTSSAPSLEKKSFAEAVRSRSSSTETDRESENVTVHETPTSPHAADESKDAPMQSIPQQCSNKDKDDDEEKKRKAERKIILFGNHEMYSDVDGVSTVGSAETAANPLQVLDKVVLEVGSTYTSAEEARKSLRAAYLRMFPRLSPDLIVSYIINSPMDKDECLEFPILVEIIREFANDYLKNENC